MTSLVSLPKCHVGLTGATFDPSLTFYEWADTGKRVVRLKESIQWLLGDWLNFGIKRYLEESGKETRSYRVKYKAALESLPYENGTLRDFAWVAGAIELSRRRDKLSFGHHREIAGIDGNEKQDHYLDLAEKDELSVADLRALIRNNAAEFHRRASPAGDPSPTQWTTQLIIWTSNQEPQSWPKPRRDAWKKELAPLVEFYGKL